MCSIPLSSNDNAFIDVLIYWMGLLLSDGRSIRTVAWFQFVYFLLTRKRYSLRKIVYINLQRKFIHLIQDFVVLCNVLSGIYRYFYYFPASDDPNVCWFAISSFGRIEHYYLLNDFRHLLQAKNNKHWLFTVRLVRKYHINTLTTKPYY